jgi:hypothetical protein
MHTVHTNIHSTHLNHGSILFLTHLVYVDYAEGEADVDDDEDEKEDEDVNDHVGHADDDGSSLPPHQPPLIRERTSNYYFKEEKSGYKCHRRAMYIVQVPSESYVQDSV